jgi:hypothetical protein
MAESISVLALMASLTGWFKGASWDAWRALLAAFFALPMTEEQVATFRQFTGRETAPTEPAREGWIIVGRRGGKSLISALIALWAAVFRSYAGILAPGERGLVMVVAADRRQARVVFRYICAFFDQIPGLAQLVARRTQDALHLTNGISIEIHTPSFRTIRGYTVVCFIGDEAPIWRTGDSANPDVEIFNAVRPAQATVAGAVFLVIGSPYARRGSVWEARTKHFGRDGDPVLVWMSDTTSMNPTVPQAVIDEAFETDEAVAWAEYGRDGVIEFRRDIETYISREVLEACVVLGRVGLPMLAEGHYVAFTDPAGGSGGDSFTLGIAHHEERAGRLVVLLDRLEERRPPFSPEATVAEFAAILSAYRITTIEGDRYAGAWPAEQFAKQGITYEPADQPKSDLYRDFLPLLTSGAVELLDLPKLHAQLIGLERRTARGGRDSIDHAPSANAHDDLANAAAGALLMAARHSLREPARLW